MKQLQLEVKERKETGTGACNRLRKEGYIPAVVYGKSGSHALAVGKNAFRDLMRASKGSATLVQLKQDGGNQTLSFIQNLHRDPTKDHFVHIDFIEVSKDQPMQATLPLHVVGESVGVRNENGILEVHVHHVDVKGLPTELPESIELDITELHTGSAIHIKELPEIKGLTYTGNPETVVASCSEARKVSDAAETATEEAGESKEEDAPKA